MYCSPCQNQEALGQMPKGFLMLLGGESGSLRDVYKSALGCLRLYSSLVAGFKVGFTQGHKDL